MIQIWYNKYNALKKIMVWDAYNFYYLYILYNPLSDFFPL